MGVEQSRQRRGLQAAMANAVFEQAMLDALRELAVESSGTSPQMIEHAWDPEDCSPNFRVLSDRLTARRAVSLTTDCIRGKKGYRTGRHVWEILWESSERGTAAAVGVATPKAPLAALGFGVLVGRNEESWGWDIVSKRLWHGGEKGPYPAGAAGFSVPDKIFVILDMDEGTLSFATSDRHLGVAFRGLPKGRLDMPMCPIVSAVYGNCDIRMEYLGKGESLLSKLRPQLMSSRSEHPLRSPSASLDPRLRSTGSPPEVTSPVIGSTQYNFDHAHGSSVAVMHGGKTAKRMNPLVGFNNGTAITAQPIKVGELFEVRVDSKVGRWFGGMDIGVTTNHPSTGLRFPSMMVECRQGTTFMWTGNKLANNGQKMTEVREDIDDLSVGDRVGVMRKADSTLHFFLNGKNIGKSVKTIPDVLYGVVDVYGKVEQVTITGETQTSNQIAVEGGGDTVSILVRMSNAINLLKMPISPGIEIIIVKLYEDIAKPFSDTNSKQLRQKYGDHLAEIGGPAYLKKFLYRLEDMGIETREGWAGMALVRSILWNYSDVSLKMAKAIGGCGLLHMLINDLKRYGPAPTKNEKKKDTVTSAVNILHNCAKASENREVYRSMAATQHLAPFAKSEDTEVAISALLTLSYIIDETEKGLLEADTKIISVLVGMLKNVTEKLDRDSETTAWSVLELVVGISNISVNENNRRNLIDRDTIPLLFAVINKGGVMEKECAANALWAFAKTEPDKKKIREMPGAVAALNALSKSPNASVQEAAKRVLLAIKPSPMTQGGQLPRRSCDYKEACQRFKASLQVDDSFFDPRHDKCYCTDCHASRNEKLYYTQGKPPKDYVLPVGWVRFSLKAPSSALAVNAPKEWNVAYHGTSPDSVKGILHSDGLVIPGDTVLGGKTISEVDGHFTDDNKPANFDTKQVFVSPSIRYSGKDVYAKVKTFKDPRTNKSYKAKVAFQLWISPGCYKVQKETIGATEEIDPKFSNQEIEWATKERGAIKLYGLLVRLEED